jgi:hypothetical protein
MYVPDFDYADARYDAQITGDADCFTAGKIDNAEKTGVITETGRNHPFTQLIFIGKWPIWQVSPVVCIMIFAERREQIRRVPGSVDWLEAA